MCGFSGIISGEKVYGANHILDSITSIKHRGVDDTLISNGRALFHTAISSDSSKNKYEKLKESSKSNIWIGFNRLSIVDLSDNAMQPFYIKSKDLWFMLVGEIYNYKELYDVHLKGTEMHSNSDSEVAFKLYLKFGDNFIQLLRGMFSIVVVDRKKHELKAWRDRFGIKPFYFATKNDSLIFSSEVSGILESKLIKKTINNQGLAYSMYLGTCPAPLTIYDNINTLEAGQQFTYNYKTFDKKFSYYWVLRYNESEISFSESKLGEDIKNLATLSLTGNVKKAIMLSGGIDSGVLAYYFGKVDREIKARTLSFSDNHLDEKSETISNAKNAKIDLKIYEQKLLSKDEVRAALLAESEPNESIEPAFIVSKHAQREDIKVLYSALGPDELFGGYSYYQDVLKFKHFANYIQYLPTFLLNKGRKEVINTLRKYGLKSYAMIRNRKFSWLDIESYISNFQDQKIMHPIEFLINQSKAKYPDFDMMPLLKQIAWLDFHYYIASHHSFRSDRVSMIHSVEMRFPYLDHIFVEKYFNIKKVYTGLAKKNKPFFRMLANKILPNDVLDMNKIGFSSVDSHISERMINEDVISNLEQKYHPLLKKGENSKVKHWYLYHLENLKISYASTNK